jgi:hypothetical protein
LIFLGPRALHAPPSSFASPSARLGAATYKLYNINRIKLENLVHRIFDAARPDIEIKDRFGQPVIPREWYDYRLSM